jgi:hypothetical protein
MTEGGNVEDWLAIRKEEALKIDPGTAEVTWHYAQTLDLYGVCPDLPEECQCIGREYFARSPGSDIWVHFGDLPEKVREALWGKEMNPNWRSLQGWKRYLSRLASILPITIALGGGLN